MTEEQRAKAKERSRRHYEANRNKIIAKQQIQRAVESEDARQYRRERDGKYYAANSEKIRQRIASHRAANRERYAETERKYRANNSGKRRDRELARRKANPDCRLFETAKSVIARQTGLEYCQVPQTLAEARALSIKLRRAIHNRTTTSNGG